MFNKKLLIIPILFILPVVLSGCIEFKTGKNTETNNGGLYKSADRGSAWAQRTAVSTASGKPASFANVNNASLTIDPNDSKALYYGSVGSGLIYTYDGGASWQVARGFENTTVRAVAVAPGFKCTIYAAIANRVMKTNDCGRAWTQAYIDTDTTVTVDALTIDPAVPAVLYIGVSRGDVIRSRDQGENWQTIQLLKDKIEKIVIDPADSRHIYVLTAKKGVYRSTDGLATVNDINGVLKEHKFSLEAKDLSFVAAEPGLIYLAVSYGLLRSSDNGQSWEKMELITPEKKGMINALAVNPKNSLEIYYVTDTVFYRTTDGGEAWRPIKLPTARAGWRIAVDFDNPSTVYLGVQSMSK